MTLTINEENAHHLTECTICRAAEKRAADAGEKFKDWQNLANIRSAEIVRLSGALADAVREREEIQKKLDWALSCEKISAEMGQRAVTALSASQDLVRRQREALREYGLRMIAASEHPLLTPEFQRQLDGILPGDAAQVGFSAAMMLWSQANRVAEAALADSPAPAEHVCDNRCRGENGHHAWPSPPPLPEGAEQDSPNFKPKELEELEARGFKRINNPRPCAVCRTKAAGLPTPGYIHDAGCPEESK